LKSIYIPIPKKLGTIECENYRTISPMSHVAKILLRMISKRIRNKITLEIEEEQCGVINDKSTANAIYIFRTLIERAIEVKVDLFLFFIDYTKAFDSIRHNEVINMLEKLHVDGKDLGIIKNIYWQQTSAVRVDNVIGTYQNITAGVRQRCVLSPD
jgi:hypothetical protein